MMLGRKGTTATTGGFGLRIFDGKSRSLQTIHIVHFSAAEHRGALRVNDDLHITLFYDRIIITRFIFERHPVLVAAAASAFDINAKSYGILFFLYQFLDLLFSDFEVIVTMCLASLV